jgi:hypothetical protein
MVLKEKIFNMPDHSEYKVYIIYEDESGNVWGELVSRDEQLLDGMIFIVDGKKIKKEHSIKGFQILFTGFILSHTNRECCGGVSPHGWPLIIPLKEADYNKKDIASSIWQFVIPTFTLSREGYHIVANSSMMLEDGTVSDRGKTHYNSIGALTAIKHLFDFHHNGILHSTLHAVYVGGGKEGKPNAITENIDREIGEIRKLYITQRGCDIELKEDKHLSFWSPSIIFVYSPGKDLTPNGVTSFAKPKGLNRPRLLINSEIKDEYNPDKLWQGYASYLQYRYHRNRRLFSPSSEINIRTSPEKAFYNGFCYAMAMRHKGSLTLCIGKENKVYRFEEMNAKGVDNEAAVAKLIYELGADGEVIFSPKKSIYTIYDYLSELNIYISLDDFGMIIEKLGMSLVPLFPNPHYNPRKDRVVFKWKRNDIASGRINYTLLIGKDYKLTTTLIKVEGINDQRDVVEYRLKEGLEEGEYYWKVLALLNDRIIADSQTLSFNVGE